MIEFVQNAQTIGDRSAVIRVFGVGGGGSNAVEHMIQQGVKGVKFTCANTDSQALARSSAEIIQIGKEITRGLGAGADPDKGRKAAMEVRDEIDELLANTDMVFITAGMGGGTGTGASPLIAEIARSRGVLTVAVVTKPFDFERRRRMEIAEKGIKELEQHVDSMIVIPNQKLLSAMNKNLPLQEAFAVVNNVLLNAVQGISDVITRPGLINVDFADVRTVMTEKGAAVMGIGSASGENRAEEAAEKAIHCPLLEDINLEGAHGMLVNVTAGPDLQIHEFGIVGNVAEHASKNASVIVGTAVDDSMSDELRVTVIATGLSESSSSADADDRKHTQFPKSLGTRRDLNSPLLRPMTSEDRATSKPSVPLGNRDDEASTQQALDIPAFLRRQAD